MMAEGGGASRISNGGIAIPLAKEFGDYLYQICNGLTDREVIDTYVEHAMKLEAYFVEIGADFERCLAMIREKLHAVPLPLQIPMGLEDAHVAALKRLDEAGRLPVPVLGHFWITGPEAAPPEPASE